MYEVGQTVKIIEALEDAICLNNDAIKSHLGEIVTIKSVEDDCGLKIYTVVEIDGMEFVDADFLGVVDICSVCGAILTEDDEAYSDHNTGETLCDSHSVFSEELNAYVSTESMSGKIILADRAQYLKAKEAKRLCDIAAWLFGDNGYTLVFYETDDQLDDEYTTDDDRIKYGSCDMYEVQLLAGVDEDEVETTVRRCNIDDVLNEALDILRDHTLILSSINNWKELEEHAISSGYTLTSKYTSLTVDEFDAKYTQIMNENEDSGLFETYGEDLEIVKKYPENQIWTVVDADDGNIYLIPGFHLTNRIHYLITEESWDDKNLKVLWHEDNVK